MQIVARQSLAEIWEISRMRLEVERRRNDVWLWFMWPQLNTAEICAALSICFACGKWKGSTRHAARSWAKNWAKWIIKRFINICLSSSSGTTSNSTQLNSTRLKSRRKLKLKPKPKPGKTTAGQTEFLAASQGNRLRIIYASSWCQRIHIYTVYHAGVYSVNS